ncbi:MAG: hypothetical protein UT01_C0025G0015 [Candidatus Daviesbacteria bacterium GW2011_GWA1_38_7]|nr:MAG: hypothetical protein UT01_C0025G0015 [Candidatus Daviesbacteria bacterium GW2011_GWA1_38_7]OGE23081.1 MAG: hypothetical protein A2688_03730 [Candidatus Daviesbacteria bacterium RIFCSPHIGHO2_01_FULL_38_8]
MAIEAKERSYVVIRSRESLTNGLNKPPTSRDYYRALVVGDFETTQRLYWDPCISSSWTPARVQLEGIKCGLRDAADKALAEETIPGISRAIDNHTLKGRC